MLLFHSSKELFLASMDVRVKLFEDSCSVVFLCVSGENAKFLSFGLVVVQCCPGRLADLPQNPLI